MTIPKHVRDALGLGTGDRVEFAVNANGDVVVLKAVGTAPRANDRFEGSRGRATVQWRTDELMALLRGS